jgi:hypothetical protein
MTIPIREGDEESVARSFRILFAGGASARFHRPHPLQSTDSHERTSEYGLGLSPRARAAIRSARMLTDAMDDPQCATKGTWKAASHSVIDEEGND